jgi:hypothetical protein
MKCDKDFKDKFGAAEVRNTLSAAPNCIMKL